MRRVRRRLVAVGFILVLLGRVPWTVAADPEATVYEGKTLAAWSAALKHNDSRVRSDTAYAPSMRGAPKDSLAPLIAAVTDEDAAVRSLHGASAAELPR